MPIIHAIVLGVVQGLSEFLPISSSGHLLLVPWVLGWDDIDDPSVKKAFDVALHIGTLVAVVAYFRSDLAVYVRRGAAMVLHPRRSKTAEGRLAWLLVLSVVPAALVGALAEDWIDTTLGTPLIIGFSLIVGGVVLGLADRLAERRHLGDYGVRDSVLVGAAQALALNPGTSRSGITITAGRLLRFDRDTAARISFLMSIPVILGAVVFKMGGLVVDGIPEGLLAPMIAGVVSAGLSGWLAVWGTLKLVRTHSFAPFVIYRAVVGAAVIVMVVAGWR